MNNRRGLALSERSESKGFVLIKLPVVRKRGLPRASSRGFTLIELLIVVGIIVIIASLVIVSVSTARERSRDAKRIADLAQIQLALELYKDAHGGVYPATRLTNGGSRYIFSDGVVVGADSNLTVIANWTALEDILKTYLLPLPKDPMNGKLYKLESDGSTMTGIYRYGYGGTVNNYKLITRLEENVEMMDEDGGVYAGGSGCTLDKSYEIYTSGAQGWWCLSGPAGRML